MNVLLNCHAPFWSSAPHSKAHRVQSLGKAGTLLPESGVRASAVFGFHGDAALCSHDLLGGGRGCSVRTCRLVWLIVFGLRPGRNEEHNRSEINNPVSPAGLAPGWPRGAPGLGVDSGGNPGAQDIRFRPSRSTAGNNPRTRDLDSCPLRARSCGTHRESPAVTGMISLTVHENVSRRRLAAPPC